jgi:hypothetical protein
MFILNRIIKIYKSVQMTLEENLFLASIGKKYTRDSRKDFSKNITKRVLLS